MRHQGEAAEGFGAIGGEARSHRACRRNGAYLVVRPAGFATRFQRLPGRDRGARRTKVDHVENDRFSTSRAGTRFLRVVQASTNAANLWSPHGLHMVSTCEGRGR